MHMPTTHTHSAHITCSTTHMYTICTPDHTHHTHNTTYMHITHTPTTHTHTHKHNAHHTANTHHTHITAHIPHTPQHAYHTHSTTHIHMPHTNMIHTAHTTHMHSTHTFTHAMHTPTRVYNTLYTHIYTTHTYMYHALTHTQPPQPPQPPAAPPAQLPLAVRWWTSVEGSRLSPDSRWAGAGNHVSLLEGAHLTHAPRASLPISPTSRGQSGTQEPPSTQRRENEEENRECEPRKGRRW